MVDDGEELTTAHTRTPIRLTEMHPSFFFLFFFFCFNTIDSILICRPSLRVADGVGQAAGRDESEQLNHGDTDGNPGHDVTGTLEEVGKPANATLRVGHTDGRGTARAAARLREVESPVQEATLAAAFQLHEIKANTVTKC